MVISNNEVEKFYSLSRFRGKINTRMSFFPEMLPMLACSLILFVEFSLFLLQYIFTHASMLPKLQKTLKITKPCDYKTLTINKQDIMLLL